MLHDKFFYVLCLVSACSSFGHPYNGPAAGEAATFKVEPNRLPPDIAMSISDEADVTEADPSDTTGTFDPPSDTPATEMKTVTLEPVAFSSNIILHEPDDSATKIINEEPSSARSSELPFWIELYNGLLKLFKYRKIRRSLVDPSIDLESSTHRRNFESPEPELLDDLRWTSQIPETLATRRISDSPDPELPDDLRWTSDIPEISTAAAWATESPDSFNISDIEVTTTDDHGLAPSTEAITAATPPKPAPVAPKKKRLPKRKWKARPKNKPARRPVTVTTTTTTTPSKTEITTKTRTSTEAVITPTETITATTETVTETTEAITSTMEAAKTTTKIKVESTTMKAETETIKTEATTIKADSSTPEVPTTGTAAVSTEAIVQGSPVYAMLATICFTTGSMVILPIMATWARIRRLRHRNGLGSPRAISGVIENRALLSVVCLGLAALVLETQTGPGYENLVTKAFDSGLGAIWILAVGFSLICGNLSTCRSNFGDLLLFSHKFLADLAFGFSCVIEFKYGVSLGLSPRGESLSLIGFSPTWIVAMFGVYVCLKEILDYVYVIRRRHVIVPMNTRDLEDPEYGQTRRPLSAFDRYRGRLPDVFKLKRSAKAEIGDDLEEVVTVVTRPTSPTLPVSNMTGTTNATGDSEEVCPTTNEA